MTQIKSKGTIIINHECVFTTPKWSSKPRNRSYHLLPLNLHMCESIVHHTFIRDLCIRNLFCMIRLLIGNFQNKWEKTGWAVNDYYLGTKLMTVCVLIVRHLNDQLTNLLPLSLYLFFKVKCFDSIVEILAVWQQILNTQCKLTWRML